MKSSKLFLILLAALIAAGCNDTGGFLPQNSEAPPTPPPVVEEPNSYELQGADDLGRACTTGRRKFDSLAAMCVGMQDPVQNNRCANRERLAKFQSECEREGYGWWESRSCRIILLKKETVLTTVGAYNQQDVLRNEEFCVGRTKSGNRMSGIYSNGWWYGDVYMNIAMTFVPAREATASKRSSFYLRLNRRTDFNPAYPITEEIEYYDGAMIHQGPTLDNSYKYIVNCAPTWACF